MAHSVSRIVIGNWKMHKTLEEARTFVQSLDETPFPNDLYVGLAVPYTYLHPLHIRSGDRRVQIGAQNMCDAAEGAFTGEIAAAMLIDVGANFVLLGHSERRRIYNESNALIRAKLIRALQSNLLPVLCVGEPAVAHEEGGRKEWLRDQIYSACEYIDEWKNDLWVAYEPIWAIGSGKYPSMDELSGALSECHELIQNVVPSHVYPNVRFLYGGSVTQDNARDFLKIPQIHGLLVGGGSLSLASFQKIVHDLS